jgi:hypothetical protein
MLKGIYIIIILVYFEFYFFCILSHFTYQFLFTLFMIHMEFERNKI